MHKLVLTIFFLLPSILFSQSNEYDGEYFEPLKQQSRSHMLVGVKFSIPVSGYYRTGVGFGLNFGADLGISRIIDFSLLGNYSIWPIKSGFYDDIDEKFVASFSYQGGFKVHLSQSISNPYVGFLMGAQHFYWPYHNTKNWLYSLNIGSELSNPDKSSLWDLSLNYSINDESISRIGLDVSLKFGL
jgi:hypothetical protein